MKLTEHSQQVCEQWASTSGAPLLTRSGEVRPCSLRPSAPQVSLLTLAPVSDSKGLSGARGCGCSGHLCGGGSREPLSTHPGESGSLTWVSCVTG